MPAKISTEDRLNMSLGVFICDLLHRNQGRNSLFLDELVKLTRAERKKTVKAKEGTPKGAKATGKSAGSTPRGGKTEKTKSAQRAEAVILSR